MGLAATVAAVMRNGRMEWLIRLGGSFSYHDGRSGEVELAVYRRRTPDSGRTVPALVKHGPFHRIHSDPSPSPHACICDAQTKSTMFLWTFWNPAVAIWQVPPPPGSPLHIRPMSDYMVKSLFSTVTCDEDVPHYDCCASSRYVDLRSR